MTAVSPRGDGLGAEIGADGHLSRQGKNYQNHDKTTRPCKAYMSSRLVYPRTCSTDVNAVICHTTLEERRGKREAYGLGGLEVDHEVKLYGALRQQFPGLRPCADLVHEPGSPARDARGAAETMPLW
jgi:hypothetical protein